MEGTMAITITKEERGYVYIHNASPPAVVLTTHCK